jgi:hypothetical protein
MSWMMQEFIPFLSATCDEILSWMVEIWMKNHLVSDSYYNICEPLIPPKNITKNEK